MLTEPVTPEFAAQLELCEVNAWLDMYAAAPVEFAHRLRLEILREGDIVLTRCKAIPFIHFNCVMTLGIARAATERQLDDVLSAYRDAGVDRPWFFHVPHCRPEILPEWFQARGLHARGGWDRIFRDDLAAVPSPAEAQDDFSVERITGQTGAEWAAFIDKIYGLPTTPWLMSLVERAGWHHYALRASGQVRAVRSMYIHHDGMAWLGIDAPIPGIMGPSFDLDARICETMVRDGLAVGARCFVTDIEAPHADMSTPAYSHFARLGFSKAYFRSHYGY
jgi:hypothetical protein